MVEFFSKSWFDDLESKLRNMGLDSDDKSFDEIKENLKKRKILSPDEFALTVIYVILAGGFRQTTAKKVHRQLMELLPHDPKAEEISKFYDNKPKISSILTVWNNREVYCNAYYKCDNLYEKITYLKTLPHVGPITANHLARNLGENLPKYDIWIQRLGVLYSGNPALYEKINNAKLNPEIKAVCDDMFSHMEQETGLLRGYIDAVLFKACQNHLIEVKQ